MKTALVTGGSRGIGWAIVKSLVRNDMKVAFNGVRPASEIENQLSELNSDRLRAFYIEGNIAEENDRSNLVAQAIAHLGNIDLLVNNAGVAPRQRNDILSISESDYDHVMDINLKGTFFLTQKIAQHMVGSQMVDGKCIIFISSVSAQYASINRSAYCLSKSGIAMLNKLMAVRLASENIPVFEIRPGIIKTDMTAGVIEKYQQLIEDGLTLEKRLGAPEDIAKIVSAIAKGALPYSTGQVITADGGLSVNRL